MKELLDKFDSYPDANAHFDSFGNAPEKESLLTNAEDFGRGVANFGGFAPIVAGAGEATADKLKAAWNGQKAKDWLDLYRQHQQESAGNFKKAKERSPYLYGAGQLTGALGAGALTAGLGDAVGLGTLGAEGAEAAGLGKTLATAAGQGAAFGGASAAAESEGNLDTSEGRQQMLSDALHGAAAGGVAAPAMMGAGKIVSPLLSKVGSKIGDIADKQMQNNPLLRQIKKSYQEGRAGSAINNETPNVATFAAQQKADTSGITNQFLDADKTLGKKIGDTIDSYQKGGVKVEFNPDAKELTEDFVKILGDGNVVANSAQTRQIRSGLQRLIDGELGPAEVKDLRANLLDLADSTGNKQVKNIANGLGDEIQNSLMEAVPELNNLHPEYSDLRKAGIETILGKGRPEEVSSTWAGDTKNKNEKLYDQVNSLLDNLTRPGTSQLESNNTVNTLVNNLKDYETKNPGLLKELGINPDTLGKDFQNKGDDFAIVRQALGYEPQHNPFGSMWGVLGGGATTGTGQLIQKANVLGRAVKTVSDSSVANLSRKIYTLPSDTLNSLASGLKNTPGLSSLGETLEKSIQDKNDGLKNAALFSILQNPQARQLISGGNEPVKSNPSTDQE